MLISRRRVLPCHFREVGVGHTQGEVHFVRRVHFSYSNTVHKKSAPAAFSQPVSKAECIASIDKPARVRQYALLRNRKGTM